MGEIQIAVIVSTTEGWMFSPTVHRLVQCVAFMVYLLLMRLSVQDFSELAKVVGRAVFSALQQSGISVKEAGALMGVHPEHFRAAMNGEKTSDDRYRLLSLAHLLRLPLRFWLLFLPMLSAMVVEQHVRELAGDAVAMFRREKV